MPVVGIPLWLWSYKRFLPRPLLAKEIIDKETGKVTAREYRTDDGDSDWRIGHWAIMGCGMFLAGIDRAVRAMKGTRSTTVGEQDDEDVVRR